MAPKLALVFSAILLMVASATEAQLTGRVAGWVFDETGAALPRVGIGLVVGLRELTTATDSGGCLPIRKRPAG